MTVNPDEAESPLQNSEIRSIVSGASAYGGDRRGGGPLCPCPKRGRRARSARHTELFLR